MTNKLALTSLLLLGSAMLVPAASADPLRGAVEDPGRTEAERERDRYRNPYETLSFFGIEPDMTVVELYPGGGWYSAILAPYLAGEGQLVAAHFNLERENAPQYYERLYNAYVERFADRDRYGDIEIIEFDPPDKAELGRPGSADMVLTFRNIHSWLGSQQLDAVFNTAYDVLKPGGVFGVVGHRLPEDRAQDPRAETGYVKESIVVEAGERAGFTLAEKSEINANPRDDADHPNGVWTLPPNLDVPEGDTGQDWRRIGESDRFTLRFVK
jgi:predicted methyltransferase